MSKLASLRFAGVSIAAAFSLASASAPAQAGSAVGTIGVALTVTSACVVNGAGSYNATLGQIGQITFAAQPGMFGTTTASAVATGNSSAISVQCSPGSTPSLTVGAGANDSGGVHRMASGTNMIAYHLYSDSARNNEITVGGSVALGTATSSSISVPIYASTTSNGAVLAAGAYTDTVNVTLNF